MKTKLLLLSAFFLVAAIAFTFTASAAIPHLMNFQGKATDKTGAPLSGTYNLTFRIYNSETGGTTKWSETQPNISITNGIFQVQLGSVTSLNLPFDEPYWISIEINTDGEMSPRTKLASVPYAYTAESLSNAPVIPFYKKGFDIEGIDFNSIKVAPGVMDVAGKMFTTTTYSSPLQLAYLGSPANGDWIHGQKTNNSVAYVYAYNNDGQIGFKFSDEVPNLADHLSNTTQRPLLYRRYPDTEDGIYYRHIGSLMINTAGAISATISQGKTEPASIFSTFGGDGAGGDVVVSSNANFSTIDDPNRPGMAQYRNLTVNADKVLTIDTGFAYIGVSGTCTIHGTIDAMGQGALGGDYGWSGPTPAGCGRNALGVGNKERGEVSRAGTVYSDSAFALADSTIGFTQYAIDYCVTGAGGGGGRGGQSSGGAGGGAGGYGAAGNSAGPSATAPSKILKLTGGLGDNSTHSTFFNPAILKYVGAGGGGGGGGAPGATLANGGAGGGCIYIECDALIFDGTITAAGQTPNNATGAYEPGGSGGGGGGVVFVRAKTIATNTGAVSVAGGAAGSGSGTVTAGAAGFKDIIIVQ